MSRLLLSVSCLAAISAPALFPGCLQAVRVTSGLSQPVFATHAPGQPNLLYIVEQGGVIQALNLTTQQRSVFLDISDRVQSGGEEGLLGLTFDHDYPTTGRLYVYYTAKYATPAERVTRVSEFLRSTANPAVADPATERLIIRFAQPQENHNGGWIDFGPDGYLYIATGDGGSGNDDGNGHTPGTGNAQDITDNLLGKILRINPFLDQFPADPLRNYEIPPANPFVGVTGDDEIWSYGLRNPWRCSFDRQTGDLWIADVGQNAREEVNFQSLNSLGGENYGWRLREGTIATPTPGIGGPAPSGAVDPIYDYAHGAGQFQGNSITGGYVYRGPVTQLQGRYFFADYISRKLWSFTKSGNTITDLTDWTTRFTPTAGSIGRISGFGEDANGNLYLIDYDGEIFRLSETGVAPRTARTKR